MKPKTEQPKTLSPRPPVVVVMGHVDHGKSTLLDYIRKTNIVEGEAGGITQHLGAYEVNHKTAEGVMRALTFIDTPGHAAFSGMRTRGAHVADIAILVVSAEDSVKAQTKEAYETIKASETPFVVAINKIDRPNANIEKTKLDLAEIGVYVEGYGGDTPVVPISAKEGTGVSDLLDMITLMADLAELTGDHHKLAVGVVIEARLDAKRGISATLIVKDGTLTKGQFIVADGALVNTRILENFAGTAIESATFSSPIRVTGFDSEPKAGSQFFAYAKKPDAEQAREMFLETRKNFRDTVSETEGVLRIPVIIKSDVAGTGEAVEGELRKLETDTVKWKILDRSVGTIGEGDIKLASSDANVIILGFNVSMDARARDAAEKNKTTVETFDIIYKLTDYAKELVANRTPKITTEEITGTAKILKTFSRTKDRQVVGGKVLTGAVSVGAVVRIMRRDFEIGTAKIVGLENHKIKATSVDEGNEFGMLIESKLEIAAGDTINVFTLVTK